jgi:hypothetical protein
MAPDHASHHILVHAELGRDRSHLPVLGMKQTRNLGLDLA